MARGLNLDDTYFFDTYALIEIVKGNANYVKFKYAKVVLSILNLAEFHYKILKDFNSKLADELVSEYESSLIEIDVLTIKEANEFRLLNKSKKLSYADCIGYTMARKYGLKFLTGDKQFINMPNVEFVK